MKRLLATLGCVAVIGGGTLLAAPSAHAGVGNCTSVYLSRLGSGGATQPFVHAAYPACVTGDIATCVGWGGNPLILAACLVN